MGYILVLFIDKIIARSCGHDHSHTGVTPIEETTRKKGTKSTLAHLRALSRVKRLKKKQLVEKQLTRQLQSYLYSLLASTPYLKASHLDLCLISILPLNL